MHRNATKVLWLIPMLMALLYSRPASSQQRPDENSLAQVRPKWRVGDSWIVETTTFPLQATEDRENSEAGPKIQWKYEVAGVELLTKQPCFRLDIKCLAEGRPQPATTLWFDAKSLALRQMQTQLPIAGGFRTVTESYTFPSGQPAPVITPLTALPLELPCFTGGTKAVAPFEFEAFAGPSGTKTLGETGFSFEVEQRVAAAPVAEVKQLLHQSFAKDLETPVVGVELKSGHQKIRQLWRANLPWAAYTDNGTTTARLIKFTPADRN